MKPLFTLVTTFLIIASHAQNAQYNRAYEAKYMQKPPVFVAGADSLKRFYFTHFPAFDTVLTKAVEKGDTAKYIRIYFSFYIDEQGYPYEAEFDRVASTRSAATENAKTIKYFYDMKSVLQKAVTEMINKMPQWRPGLQDGRIVTAHYTDYLQFWVGLSAPQ
jgi:hypothetical protein